MLSICLCAFGPSVCFLWRNVYLYLLLIFFLIFFFLMLSCLSCLCILEIIPLLVASFVNNFSHSGGCLFVLFIVFLFLVFAVKTLFRFNYTPFVYFCSIYVINFYCIIVALQCCVSAVQQSKSVICIHMSPLF